MFLFEDLPAADRKADKVFLDQVRSSEIYLGLFGNEYGWEDEQGISPTEHEFIEATKHGKLRLIYVKGAKASDYVVLGLASGLRHFLWNSCIVDYCMVFPYEYPSKLFVS